MTRTPLMLALVATVALGGCAHSPPTRILTLDATAPAPAAVRGDYRGPPVAIPAVHVPAAIDRAEYVSQPGAAEVRIDDFARWAAPLGILARDALVRDLAARLPAGTVLPPGLARGRNARTIDVTIVALDLQPGRATMQAAWRALPAGPVHQAVLTTGGVASPVSGAQAMALLVGQLADRMAATLGDEGAAGR